MSSQLFRTKPLTVDDAPASGLKRCLGAFDLTLLGIGAIIGTGIFVLTGIAAATQAGPAIVLSFVVAGIACACAALSYAELAASVGGCGSAYGYSYATFGEFIAWIIGWDLILEYGFSVAAVANGWAGYFITAMKNLGWEIPAALTTSTCATTFSGNGFDIQCGQTINLPAAGIVLFLMLLLIIGVKESARTNAVMVLIKLITIAIFLVVAVGNTNADNWTPFMPFGWFGYNAEQAPIGVLAAASTVFFAYIGFDAVSTAAEETRNPKRDLPLGILWSLAFCTVIYIAVSGLLTGMVNYTELNVPQPVAHALSLTGFKAASTLVSIGVITGLTTVMLVLYYGLTRVLLAISRDGLLPAGMAAVSPRTQTPIPIITGCGIIMAIIAGSIPLSELKDLVVIGTLFAFVLVCIGVIALRAQKPEMHRPFTAPFHPVLPAIGAVVCTALIAFLPPQTWWRFLIWLAIGMVIYFTYSIGHSKLARA